jgi:rhamnogalacturonyl hydrolase YesR
MSLSAELIIVPPRSAPEAAGEFVSRCVISGINFYFEKGDQLPGAVPAGLSGVRAIVIEDDEVDANADVIAAYANAGAIVYRMRRANAATVPNATLSWNGDKTFHAICFDANLTYRHPELRRKMLSRPEQKLLSELGERVLTSENTRWYDAVRYQWAGMVDGYEVTGDERFLRTAGEQMLSAIENIPNDLTNCDTVAPLNPILRAYEHTGDQRLLDYSIRTFERYLEITPRCRGCLVNFIVYANQVRSEILLQVLPGLMRLARVTGKEYYAQVAMDQYAKLRELLFDEERGLWHHGCYQGGRSTAFWSRGVSFALQGELHILEQARPGDPHRDLCLKSFQRGVASLTALQNPLGFWYSIVDEPDSENESSGTAWMCGVLHMGMRLGFLGSEYQAAADRAWEAVKSRIWQGSYPGHMVGTGICKDRSYYLKQHLSDTGWSHFAYHAACERRRGGEE